MPFILRRSGPDFDKDGKIISPKALVGICDGCGHEGAPFGFVDPATGKKSAWCGWKYGSGYCKAGAE